MAASKYKVSFPAEIRQVSSRKLITNDIEYKLVVAGSDPNILSLGTIDADSIVQVTVEPGDG